jgi:hypothetical protein
MNTKAVKKIHIAKDFSRVPAGRYHPDDGPATGERFRTEFLVPALKKYDTVIVNIDGTAGYGSSFLDEAFAGLVFKQLFTFDEVMQKLVIESNEPKFAVFKSDIKEYLEAVRPS